LIIKFVIVHEAFLNNLFHAFHFKKMIKIRLFSNGLLLVYYDLKPVQHDADAKILRAIILILSIN